MRVRVRVRVVRANASAASEDTRALTVGTPLAQCLLLIRHHLDGVSLSRAPAQPFLPCLLPSSLDWHAQPGVALYTRTEDTTNENTYHVSDRSQHMHASDVAHICCPTPKLEDLYICGRAHACVGVGERWVDACT
jgi:hypothetical protein